MCSCQVKLNVVLYSITNITILYPFYSSKINVTVISW